MLPLAAWLVAVPEVYTGFAHRYQPAGVDVLHQPLSGFRTGLMEQRWAIYRSFFEWPFLFDRAESHVMSSTYTTGIFLKAMGVLIPIGAYHILRNRRTPDTVLILVVFLSAPLAASLINEPHTIDRALVLLPMGALLGAFGIDWLLVRRIWFADWAGMAACVGLSAWMAVQFDGFYRDYLTAYRVRSAFWFHGNHPGAFAPIVGLYPRADSRLVYLSDGLPRIREHWKLYAISRGRPDLLARTVYFTQQSLHLTDVRPGSVLLTGADDAAERSFLKMSAVKAIAHTVEPDGSPSFTLFERTGASVSYPFDGTYSAKVSLACTPRTSKAACVSLPSTVACPSTETVTVANNVVADNCGYLNQAELTPKGVYTGVSPTYGIPITGTFATTGTFPLLGSGASGGNQYDLTFLVTMHQRTAEANGQRVEKEPPGRE
jgi:hypothetical protein